MKFTSKIWWYRGMMLALITRRDGGVSRASAFRIWRGMYRRLRKEL